MGFKEGYFGQYATTGASWQEAAKVVAEQVDLVFDNLDAAMTREEMAAITAAYLKSTGNQYAAADTAQFADIGGSKYADDIIWLQSVGGIGGYSEADGSTTFRPAANILRCETAKIIENLLSNVKRV